MGKSKQNRSKMPGSKRGGGKGPSQGLKGTLKAFKVNVHKVSMSKQKAKAVTTNLKRLNVQNRQQVTQSDSAFNELQKDKMKTHKSDDTKKTTAQKSYDFVHEGVLTLFVRAGNPQPILLPGLFIAESTSSNATKHAEPNMDEATKLMGSL